MSHVSAAPELMHSAATELATIGANLNAAHLTAAGPTVGLIPAAADEVSESIAQLFSGEAKVYQKLAGQAAVFHDEFIQRLSASAGAYAGAEAANVSLLGRPVAEATAAIIPGVSDGELNFLLSWLPALPGQFLLYLLDSVLYQLRQVLLFLYFASFSIFSRSTKPNWTYYENL